MIPIRFTQTTLPTTLARVEAVAGRVLTVRYLDGVFVGLRGIVRLKGWTREAVTR